MSFATVAVIVGSAAAAASTGYALSGAGQPSTPNLAASSAQMAQTQAELLPYIMALQAAAQEGSTALNVGYTTSTEGDQLRAQLQSQLTRLQNKLQQAQNAPQGRGKTGTSESDQARITDLQSQIANVQGQISNIPAGSGKTVYLNKKGEVVPASQAVANFQGFGTGDIQGKIMTDEAQNQLALAQKFDPLFIQAALDQEKQANPQGVAARDAEYNLIQQQIKNKPQSPVADTLESQIAQRVAAGSNLTPAEQAELDKAVQDAMSAQGGSADGVDFSRALTTGMAGTQRAGQAAGLGTFELASGQTPEDIQYRAEQQNLANLASFIKGQSPQSQFRELSGAQQGPTPIANAAPQPTLPQNAAAMGANAAAQNYGLQVQNALSQVNPWLQGLSGALGIANVAGSAGWKPLGNG